MHRNTFLVLETIVVFLAASVCAVLLQTRMPPSPAKNVLYILLLTFQGLWFYRFYIVGHEAAHKKLFPESLRRNDFWGTLLLIPILTPINIYRKIHYFHHGFNRKDDHTSALDTYVIRGRYRRLKTVGCYVLWYLSIFAGGFFLHSLVSVLLFLFIPPAVTVRISPAFKGWKMADQLRAIALFAVGAGFHLAVFFWLGKDIYLWTLGYPMLAFAWWLSMLVYIFHFDTTRGNSVRYNVRSVKRIPFFSWVLMNFNEHATHHQYPNIPWYQLPEKRTPLPEAYSARNQNTWNFFRAIAHQLKGPDIVYE